jgi:hypothetical protein
MKNLLFITLLVLFTFSAFGWGPNGHRAAGWIADKHLSKKARKELNRILNGQSLAMASTWMDDIRSDSAYDYTSDWHWVTIPEGDTYNESEKNPNGDIIQTLERIVAALKSRKLSTQEEVEHVKMLIHLIGDVHQPLHVGTGTDRGGNDIKVTWFRAESNLHRVWDSDMIEGSKLSFTELAESLDKPTTLQIQSWQKTNVYDWVAESMAYRDEVYDYGDGKLGYLYSYKHFHIVRHRLLQSGIRLAGVLNDIYK